METGGAGDNSSQGDQVEPEEWASGQGNIAAPTLRSRIHDQPPLFPSRNIKAGVNLFSNSTSMLGSKSWPPIRWLLLD